MRDASGATACDVVASGFETFACPGESRTASPAALRACARDATRSQAAKTGGSVGGGVSQVLGRIARSAGRVFGKDDQGYWQEREEVMCPVCLANAALIAAGATSSGGLTAFAMNKFCKKKT